MTMRIAILVLACVSCGPGVTEEALHAETPASLPSEIINDLGQEVHGTDALDCLADLPPFGTWARNQGWGSGPDISSAMSNADRDARQRLLDEKGRDLSSIEKQELGRAIDTTFSRPKYRCGGGRCEACAVAIVQKDKLGPSLLDAGRQFTEALQSCVGTFCGKFEDRRTLRVRVSAPVWDDGRSAERLGPMLAVSLKGALSGAGASGLPGLVFLGNGGGRADVTLGGDLSQHANGCALALRYKIEGESYWHYFEQVTFHPRALAQRDCRPPPETFVSDGRVGLEQGERIGSSGLRFEAIDAPVVDGRMCEGKEFRFSTRLNEPAFVRIYSLADDGKVLLGWRSDGAVTDWSPEDAAVPIRMAGGQQYRIVL